MQVNVKELTGVLHLNVVFTIVLVLQSFLAVSSEVCFTIRPSARTNTHEQLLSPPEIERLLLQLLTR